MSTAAAQEPLTRTLAVLDPSVEGFAFAVGPDGAMIVAAQAPCCLQIPDLTSFGGSAYGVLLRKYSADGKRLWSSLIGGSTVEGRALAVDSSGFIYLAGVTYGDFPTTPGAFKTAIGLDEPDVFVCKLDPTGKELIYSTLFGGRYADSISSLALDSEGQAILGGWTDGLPFAAPGALNVSTTPSVTAGYVAKLNAAGSGVVFASYVGGDALTWVYSVAVGRDGDILIGGATMARDLPVVNPFQGGPRGQSLVRFDGAAWQAVDGAPDAQSFTAGPDGVLYVGGLNRVYRSDDGGRTWQSSPVVTEATRFQSQLRPYPVNGVALDPADARRLFASVFMEGVFESRDGGASWLRYGQPVALVRGLAVAGGSPFIVHLDRGGAVETYSGASRTATLRFATLLGVDPRTGTGYAGSKTGGLYKNEKPTLWAPINLSSRIGQLAISPESPSILYSGGSSVEKSVDGGFTWTAASKGLPATGTALVAVDPLTPTSLVAATPRGLFRSSDGADSWEPMPESPANRAFRSISIAPPSIFAVTEPSTDGFVARLSADGSTLLSSTYLGGAAMDSVVALAPSPDGGVVTVGNTLSFDFPVTGDAAQPGLQGVSGSFFSKLDPSGASLSYSTHLASRTLPPCIAVNDEGLTVAAIPQATSGDLAVLRPDGSFSLYRNFAGPDVAPTALGFSPAGSLLILGRNRQTSTTVLLEAPPDALAAR
jgi:photosystem II stability/assembly factor-like uncharacterized protein